jgi:hypothetical protein
MSTGHGGDEVAAGWRSGRRGARGKSQRGRKAGPGKGRATRGACPSRRWRRGGAGAAVSGADNRRQRSRAGARGGRRGKGVRRTSLEFAKNLRDFTVNQISH